MSGLTLKADAGLSGGEVRLALAWSDAATAARSLGLIRARGGYPNGPFDGEAVFDLADLFASSGGPYGAVDALRFLRGNRAAANDAAAEIVEFFATPASAQPMRVRVRVNPGGGAVPVVATIDGVTRVVRAVSATAAFGQVVTLQVYAEPAGGAETLVGTATLSTAPTAAGLRTQIKDFSSGTEVDSGVQTPAANLVSWTPSAGPTTSAAFAREDQRSAFGLASAGASALVRFLSCATPQGRAGLPLSVQSASFSTPIAIGTATPHALPDGARISILGATGNSAANGTWKIKVTGPNQFLLVGSSGNGAYAGGGLIFPPLLAAASLAETPNILTREIDRSLTIKDLAPVAPGETSETFYYTAFQLDLGGALEAAASASVAATNASGFSDRLYSLVPSVHRYYDAPASGMEGSFQLRRFLNIFGPALDSASALSDSLPDLFDPRLTRAEYLPVLAQTIGWQLDRTLPTERQRVDLAFAPEVFASIGSAANVQALATRGTGWVCHVKPFVDNVFLTNGVESAELWQIFEAESPDPATAFPPPAIQANLYPADVEPATTQADPTVIDSRPAAALDASGKIWLFWHSSRLGAEWRPGVAYGAAPFATLLAPASAGGLVYECTTAGTSGATAPAFPKALGATVADGGAVWTCRGPGVARRRLWLQRLGTDFAPVRALADLPDDAMAFDESPSVASANGTIVLAWASNRSGHAEIWTRAWPGASAPPGPARQLTEQEVDNRAPALAAGVGAGAPLYGFWESTNQGQTLIWFAESADGGVSWSAPSPITQGPHDHTPAAVVDAANELTLFFSASGGGGAYIGEATQAGAGGGSWTFSQATAPKYAVYDTAPASVLWKGAVHLFWTSNLPGRAWTASTNYQIDDVVVPAQFNGFFYRCVKAGESGAAVPAFPTAAGVQCADNSVQWTCCGSIAGASLAKKTRIWQASGPGFSGPSPVFARVSRDREPAAVVESGGGLHLFFSSQETGARFASRTFDTRFTPPGRLASANSAAKAAMGGLQDRLHYTYDCRTVKEAFAARDAVGIFLDPADGQAPSAHQAAADTLRAQLTTFRPLTARFVYYLPKMGGTGFTPVGVDA
jgi:hypothetical protein